MKRLGPCHCAVGTVAGIAMAIGADVWLWKGWLVGSQQGYPSSLLLGVALLMATGRSICIRVFTNSLQDFWV